MNPLLVWIMAIATGATVANLYYNQPLLVVIGQSFHASSQEVGFIPMLTQIGYAVGMLLFGPLGDLVERRKLITLMVSSTAGVLALAALSPNLLWLVVVSFAIGLTSVVAQILVPFAALLAPSHERGKVVGTVMSGLLIGILSARTVSGFVGAALGWQAVYWLGSAAMVVLAVILAKTLPRSQPTLKISYDRLLVSLWQVGREQPVLQEAALIGAVSFGVFSAFWSTLVFLLEQPPYRYGSDVAGLFGLVGIVGALAAPQVGKIADRRGHRFTVKLGIVISTIAFLVFWVFGLHLWGLILGVILLDLGVQTTQISNQAGIYSLPKEIHSRLNALYIMFYFVGGAIGSYLGSYGWNHWGWNGVCGLSLLLLAIAFASFLRRRSITAVAPPPSTQK